MIHWSFLVYPRWSHTIDRHFSGGNKASLFSPSVTNSSNKYKLAREGEKDKEKDEDIEKGKDFFFIIFFFMMKSSSVERDEFSVVA